MLAPGFVLPSAAFHAISVTYCHHVSAVAITLSRSFWANSCLHAPFDAAIQQPERLKQCEDVPVWRGSDRMLRKREIDGGAGQNISAKGEIESHRLACSFTNCALDSPWAQNGCAVHRAQGASAEQRRQGDSEWGEYKPSGWWEIAPRYLTLNVQ